MPPFKVWTWSPAWDNWQGTLWVVEFQSAWAELFSGWSQILGEVAHPTWPLQLDRSEFNAGDIKRYGLPRRLVEAVIDNQGHFDAFEVPGGRFKGVSGFAIAGNRTDRERAGKISIALQIYFDRHGHNIRENLRRHGYSDFFAKLIQNLQVIDFDTGKRTPVTPAMPRKAEPLVEEPEQCEEEPKAASEEIFPRCGDKAAKRRCGDDLLCIDCAAVHAAIGCGALVGIRAAESLRDESLPRRIRRHRCTSRSPVRRRRSGHGFPTPPPPPTAHGRSASRVSSIGRNSVPSCGASDGHSKSREGS